MYRKWTTSDSIEQLTPGDCIKFKPYTKYDDVGPYKFYFCDTLEGKVKKLYKFEEFNFLGYINVEVSVVLFKSKTKRKRRKSF